MPGPAIIWTMSSSSLGTWGESPGFSVLLTNRILGSCVRGARMRRQEAPRLWDGVKGGRGPRDSEASVQAIRRPSLPVEVSVASPTGLTEGGTRAFVLEDYPRIVTGR